MNKSIFYSNKSYPLIKIFIVFIITIIIIFVILYFYITSKKYFIILEFTSNFYSIPEDKQGEKIKYLDKKSINNFDYQFSEEKFNKIDNLKYSIQIYSDINILNVENYFLKLINNNEELININDFYLFFLESDIGKDYFLSYKNFENKDDAMKECNMLTFINICTIINVQNLQF
tara:strand:- start:9 stop:530 length:522 start_codon:yes stop_codon:yes gene_type:complete